MTLNAYQREKIIEALLNYRKNQFDGTDSQFAKIFDINASAFNRLKKGERERIIRDDKLVTIGRKLEVHWRDAAPWKIVETEVYQYITEQLKYCKQNSIARIYCDLADVGKTTAAKAFMLREKNVFYLDCSKVKARTQFVRALARVVGVNDKGSIAGVIADTVYMIQCIDRPLVILDEAGDLHYEAWLEIKAFWNALEGYCGWYMMGADGLRVKIENNVRNKKVGYAEIFRRFGSEFMCIANKKDKVNKKIWYYSQAEIIAHANLPQGYDYAEFVSKRRVDSLTRLKEDIQKIQKPNLLPLQTAEA
jgi:hypothetical protein